MAREVSDENPLTPDDGDEAVDPPEQCIAAGDRESLDARLAEEVPDMSPGGADLGQAVAADRSPDARGW